MDKELEKHLKMWDGTPYDMALVEDIYDLGYGIGKKRTTQQFKEYLEKLIKEFTDEEAGYFVIRRIINELFPKTGNDDSENDE